MFSRPWSEDQCLWGESISLIIVVYTASLVSTEFSPHESMPPLAAMVILSVLSAYFVLFFDWWWLFWGREGDV